MIGCCSGSEQINLVQWMLLGMKYYFMIFVLLCSANGSNNGEYDEIAKFLEAEALRRRMC